MARLRLRTCGVAHPEVQMSCERCYPGELSRLLTLTAVVSTRLTAFPVASTFTFAPAERCCCWPCGQNNNLSQSPTPATGLLNQRLPEDWALNWRWSGPVRMTQRSWSWLQYQVRCSPTAITRSAQTFSACPPGESRLIPRYLL